MVPFPSAEYYTDPLDHRKRLKKSWANSYLEEHPDGNGLLIPRMKEEVRKEEAWRTIFGPTHDAVQVVGQGGWKDAVAHGLAEYWAKLAFAAGGSIPKSAYLVGGMVISPKMHDKKRYETLEHHFFEEDNLSHMIRAIHDVARTEKIPPEIAKKMAAAYPDILRAAIALSNVAERAYKYGYGKEAHKKVLRGILQPSELDALIEIMESKITPPHHIVKRFALPEELEAIYKVHKRFLDMFPHLFEEKKTPFEELIPEERRKELDEIIEIENKLTEAILQKKLRAEYVLPERKEKRLIQLKKEHYLDALRKLGLTTEEKAGAQQQMSTTAPAPTAQSRTADPLTVRKEKENFTIYDVDMSKVEKHPETGLPIIRNGDQIVVLPPHKHPKEIPNMHDRADPPGVYVMFANALRYGATPEDLENISKDLLETLRWVREEAIKHPEKDPTEIFQEAHEKWKQISQKYSNRAKENKGVSRAIDFAESIFSLGKYIKKEEAPTYHADNLATEVAAGEVAIVEALKLARDLMAHPEKYGLDTIKDPKEKGLAIRKIFFRVFSDEKKVVGFPHKDRADSR